MSELKACPFCEDIPKESVSGNTYKIECEGAFCGMASIHGPVFDTQSTRDAWNNRPHENKIKSEAVREFVGQYEYNKDHPEFCVRKIGENYANKLERG